MPTQPAVDVQLDREAVADRAGVKVGSICAYMQRGTMPSPDGKLGRTPWWWSSTIEQWLATRPSRGYSEATHGHLAKHPENNHG